MRLLLVNPNISDSVSDLIRAEAQRSASPGTEIEVLTAPFGVAYIETRFESLVGAYATAQVAAEHVDRFDAVVVAAFGDPGLMGLRELLPVPVTGMTEAALASAHLLGTAFPSSPSRSASRPGTARWWTATASAAAWPASARSIGRSAPSAGCRKNTRRRSRRWRNVRSPRTAPK